MTLQVLTLEPFLAQVKKNSTYRSVASVSVLLLQAIACASSSTQGTPTPADIAHDGTPIPPGWDGAPPPLLDGSQAWQDAGWVPDGSSHTDAGAPDSAVSDDPPPIKSIGFDLDYYNGATETAGEMKFTKTPLLFDQIWGDFGQQDPRTNDPTKRNPQPTFILPLGTKVRSLIDGEIISVKELYSQDFTVMTARSKNSTWIVETEHVKNVLVVAGQKVTAGQVIAEVSDHDSQNHAGFGILEIGILHPVGSTAKHACPFKYLDDSIKVEMRKKINALYTAWETYLGKDVYKQETYVSPGCVTEDLVDG